MGWDAYAVYENGDRVARYKKGSGVIIEKGNVKSSFEEAFQQVREKCGTVDGSLNLGGLDVSLCGEAFMTLFEVDAWPEGEGGKYDLSPDEVRKLAEDYADIRDFLNSQYNKSWYLWPTLEFVRVCAKHNLAIRFSY